MIAIGFAISALVIFVFSQLLLTNFADKHLRYSTARKVSMGLAILIPFCVVLFSY